MPLTADTMLYDLQAENLFEGGVQYREIFEPNLPAVVWLHMAIRSLLGRSSEAMRLADLVIFTGIVWLLADWVRRLQGTGNSRTAGSAPIWTAVLLYLCYFSVSEWCHCQRDTWMLLPGLAALCLRHRQVARAATGTDWRILASWALLEGLCWGAAVWIKPHIVIPAVCGCLVGACYMRRVRVIAIDMAGLLVGGLLAGGAGIAWMCWTGAWPYFLDVFLNWNPYYVEAGHERRTIGRLLRVGFHLLPWSLLHFVAIPLAVRGLVRNLTKWKNLHAETRNSPPAPEMQGSGHANSPSLPQGLFNAFYIGSVLQAFCLQHPFDYIHSPICLLAITWLVGGWGAACRTATSASPTNETYGSAASCHASRQASAGRFVIGKLALTGVVLIAVLVSPATRFERLRWWRTCLREGSTPAVRDALSDFFYPDSQDLQRVAQFLKSRGIRDGELTCFTSTVVHLYHQLDLRPSTRYVYLAELLHLIPQQRAVIREALSASRQRYVVTDLIMCGLTPAEAKAIANQNPHAPPPLFPPDLDNAYPWSHPVVFRAGRYLVHRIESPIGNLDADLRDEVNQRRRALYAAAKATKSGSRTRVNDRNKLDNKNDADRHGV